MNRLIILTAMMMTLTVSAQDRIAPNSKNSKILNDHTRVAVPAPVPSPVPTPELNQLTHTDVNQMDEDSVPQKSRKKKIRNPKNNQSIDDDGMGKQRAPKKNPKVNESNLKNLPNDTAAGDDARQVPNSNKVNKTE